MMCLRHIEDLKVKGFMIGAKVKTKWGVPGTIRAYKEVPKEGIEFFGTTTPAMMSIDAPHISPNLFYNEGELTLVAE